MAEITCCDRCGAMSPNPVTKLHDANRWMHLHGQIGREPDAFKRSPDWKRVYCEACWEVIGAATTPVSDPMAPPSRSLLPRRRIFNCLVGFFAGWGAMDFAFWLWRSL